MKNVSRLSSADPFKNLFRLDRDQTSDCLAEIEPTTYCLWPFSGGTVILPTLLTTNLAHLYEKQ